MLDLIARRTKADPSPASPTAPAPAPGWIGRLAARLGSAPAPAVDPALSELAGLATTAREVDEIRVALVRLAASVVGSGRAELLQDRGGHLARRLASWPGGAHPSTLAEPPSGPRGPIVAGPDRARGRRGMLDRPAGPLLIPLKAGDSTFGTLRLTLDRPTGRDWPPAVVERLRALCAVAAVAERALVATAQGRPELDPTCDPDIGPRGSALLGAFLGFALAQARRRHESLSLLDVAVDRLAALRGLMGEEQAEAAIDRVARAIKATVRASDVIARLEDGRIAVILPDAGAGDAERVAEGVRASIARACAASMSMPGLTASIGVATYPEQARDCPTLRAAASSARGRAQAGGTNRVASAPASALPALRRPESA